MPDKRNLYTLVSQSFGKPHEYRRVALCILSFYAHADEKSETILFTDNPDWFQPYLSGLPVTYVLLTDEKIKQMRGAIDFLHRMKICLIDEAFDISGTHLLYADSDTFFTADPTKYFEKLTPAKSHMHLHEYKFEYLRNMALPAGETFRAFVNLIETTTPIGAHDRPISVTAENSSWNAGVMMLHSEHKQFIPDVFALTDCFYPKTRNHAAEQYAFSVVLQTRTDLQPCDDVIYHYWYRIKKDIADDYLEKGLKTVADKTVAERKAFALRASKELVNLFETHVWALKDHAVQAFNEDKFKAGLAFAGKAFLKGALGDIVFIKDTLYHIKRLSTKKNDLHEKAH